MGSKSDYPFDGRRTLWVVHIGKDDQIAIQARDKGFVCIGWTKLGNLSEYKTREALKQAMARAWPDWKPKRVSGSYGQVWRFAHEMKIGDPVVLPIKPSREIAIGRISGEYRFGGENSELYTRDCANLRDVKWISVVPRTVFSQAALHSFGAFSTVSTSDDFLEEVVAVLQGRVSEIAESPDEGSSSGPQAEADEGQDLDLYGTALQETEDYLLKAWHRTGAHFEHVVAALFQAMGYTASVTQASGDHGVDVIAHPDPLGLQQPFIKVQVKSGASSVGEPQVNQLKGALNAGEQGIVIALGGFTSGAQSVARASSNLRLLDANQFVSLFLDHYDRLEPSWQARYPLKRVFVPVL